MSLTRRALLSGSAGALVAMATASLAGCSSSATQPVREWQPRHPMAVPPQLSPTAEGRCDLRVGRGRHAFLPGLPADTMGINQDVLGPTLRLRRGDRVRPRVHNTLDEVTTMHWHGIRLPAAADGGPHQPIAPGSTWSPSWVLDQPAATCWYHPHPHGQTARQVYRGLAGLLIIDDDNAVLKRLPHTYGVDDIPVIIQDRTIDVDGALQSVSRPTWGLMGGDIVCNATMEAYLDVTAERTRLRLLNGSNARVYRLQLAGSRSFAVIAGDAGLLPHPVEVDTITLSPAERAEIIVTLRPGERLRLQSRNGDQGVDAGDFDILELRVAGTLTPSPPLPSDLGGEPPIEAPPDARVRTFTMQGHDSINGEKMDMSRIDETILAGACEIWKVTNTSYAHNFHVHGVDFTILDIDGSPPPPALAGRKDTVFTPSKATATLAVQFARYTDPALPYMYHCHILRHEDAGMMGQFTVVDP